MCPHWSTHSIYEKDLQLKTAWPHQRYGLIGVSQHICKGDDAKRRGSETAQMMMQLTLPSKPVSLSAQTSHPETSEGGGWGSWDWWQWAFYEKHFFFFAISTLAHGSQIKSIRHTLTYTNRKAMVPSQLWSRNIILITLLKSSKFQLNSFFSVSLNSTKLFFLMQYNGANRLRLELNI